MTFIPSRLVHPAVLDLKPYQPGKPISECQREFGIGHFIKLASNENPLGTSKHVTERLIAELSHHAYYPDGSAYDLKVALSQHLAVNMDQLILGNGSEDVLKMILQTFVWGDFELLLPQYAFIAHKILAKGLGLTVKEVPSPDFTTDLTGLLHAVTPKTRMIILANPNNPTGTYVTEHALRSFLDQLPKEVIVVCDEAYYEYMDDKAYPQTLFLLARYPNLVITRTFSKAYGLAGLRLGYGIADPSMIELVNRLRQPFNVNHLAQLAGKFALEDQIFVQKTLAVNAQGKKQYYEGLPRLGLQYIPSGANFIMVKKPQGKDLFQALLQKGVIIRPLDPYQLTDYVRISIGTPEENQACLEALEQVVVGEKVV